MKKNFILWLGIIAILMSFGWFAVKNFSPQESVLVNQSSIRVVATFYPLQQLAQAVVGEMGVVESIVPAGMEPHDYEPSAQDIKKIYQSDLLLLNGSGMDPWAEKITPELKSRGIQVINFAEKADLLPGEGGQHDEEKHEEEGHEEEEGIWDPHYWLDPVMAEREVRAIAESLAEKMPEKRSFFEGNAQMAILELQTIDKEYRAGLSLCRLRTVITTHQAFGYLAKQYNFSVLSMSGLSPEEEPSTRRLADLAAEMKKQNINFVLFESLVSPRVAETLARTTGAQTLVFHPIEGVTDEEQAAGKNYFSLMRENLNTLQKALECQ